VGLRLVDHPQARGTPVGRYFLCFGEFYQRSLVMLSRSAEADMRFAGLAQDGPGSEVKVGSTSRGLGRQFRYQQMWAPRVST